MNKLLKSIATTCVLGLWAASASAGPVSVDADNFGTITTLNGGLVEFSGDGIPSDATNWSDFTDVNGNTLRLGLSATPRFSADTPTNDGAGTFFVDPGLDNDGRSLWNFSFYAETSPGLDIRTIGLELLYDLDAGTGTDEANLGVFFLSTISLAQGGGENVIEGSQNSTFGFLASGVAGLINAPSVAAFDPNSGEYSFALRATGFGSVGINVNVNSVSSPSVALLFGVFAAAAFISRRRKAKA